MARLRLGSDDSGRRVALVELVDEGDLDELAAEQGVLGALGEHGHEARLLVLEALAAEVAARLEVPAVVAARPVGEVLDVHREVRVDLGAERGHALERVEEARLDILVEVDDPRHRVVKVDVELVHRDREDIVPVVARRLLLVV